MVKHVRFDDKVTMPVINTDGKLRMLKGKVKQVRMLHKILFEYNLNTNGWTDDYGKIVDSIPKGILPKKAIKSDEM
jgi:hypothetical protein